MARPEPMDRVSFETDHLCQVDPPVLDRHSVSGWQSATPGLAVFHNAGPNAPCGPDPDDPTYGEWTIWNTTYAYRVWGADDPEAAMQHADQLGRYRDWEAPPDSDTRTINRMLDDMAERGEW